MSLLRRTNAGLSVLHRFLKVDVVVLCEGAGEAAGTYRDSRTTDAVFWSRMFQEFSPRQCHVSSAGSKSALELYALGVQSGEISNLVVCLDRDFDDIVGKMQRHPRIIYTHSYSWETDVFNFWVIATVFSELYDDAHGLEKAVKHVLQEAKSFLDKARDYIEFDIAFVTTARPALFNRQSPGRYVHMVDGKPCLDTEGLRAELARRSFMRGPRRKYRLKSREENRRIFGKMWSRFVYKLLINSLQTKATIDYKTFSRISIKHYTEALSNRKPADQYRHYVQAIANVS